MVFFSGDFVVVVRVFCIGVVMCFVRWGVRLLFRYIVFFFD